MSEQARLLSEAEFKATFSLKMLNVTDSSTTTLDMWKYVESIPSTDLRGHAVMVDFIEAVYRNVEGTYEQILVMTRSTNVFLVILVDLKMNLLYGHYLLDLNREYGLE